jgi:hypothetical protein
LFIWWGLALPLTFVGRSREDTESWKFIRNGNQRRLKKKPGEKPNNETELKICINDDAAWRVEGDVF